MREREALIPMARRARTALRQVRATAPAKGVMVCVPLCAAALAACGSSGTGGGTGTGAAGSPNPGLQYAQCMRAHGVPNFPDPSASGDIAITPASGVDPRSPKFATASQACAKYGPGKGAGGGPVPAAKRARLIALSQCMRAHGVPSFPDPTFPSSGGARIELSGGNVDPRSPAFQAASRACGGPKPGPGQLRSVAAPAPGTPKGSASGG